MRKTITNLALVIAGVMMSACATNPQAEPQYSNDVDQAAMFKEYIAIRDFPVRTAPTMEADIASTFLTGDRFIANLNLDPSLDWRKIELQNQDIGFVFGLPVVLAE